MSPTASVCRSSCFFRAFSDIFRRNFGIQVATYATISDIVVYSPRGATRAATELARRIKLAVERKAEDRWVRMRAANKIVNEEQGPGAQGEIGYGTGLLAYNVFVVTGKSGPSLRMMLIQSRSV